MKNSKNFLKPVLFLSIVLFFLLFAKDIDFVSMMANIEQGLRVVKITDEKSQIIEDNLTIRFKVPSIHYNNQDVEKNINSYIKRNIKEYINIQKQINKISPNNEKKIINITYSVVFEDENIINMIIDKNTTLDEKRYKLERDSYVFSLTTGDRIYLDEFLKDNENYSDVIAKVIKSEIDKNHPLYEDLSIDKHTNYYIEDRYINIYFNPYKQSQDTRKYEFKIPYDVFDNKIEVFNMTALPSVDKEIIKKNDKYLKSTLEIPIIENDNPDMSSLVNKRIKEDILSFYDKTYKEAKDYIDDFQLSDVNFVGDSSFEIKKIDENIISILVRYYKYLGGAHGYYEYIPYNIDLQNGKNITLKEIFKTDVDYKTIINNEVDKQIKNENLDKVFDFYGIKENQKFYISDGELVVYFDLYEIAPYAAGVPEFSLDLNEIEYAIKDNYFELIN